MTQTPWFDLPQATSCGWQRTSNVAVIGAGIAGLCTARALAKNGFNVTVYDSAAKCAAGASGSPAGIVKPYVTRVPSDAMRFHDLAYATLMRWLAELESSGGYRPIGALQLVGSSYGDRDAAEKMAYELLDAQTSSTVSGVTLNSASIFFKHAGWLPVWKLCESLLLDLEERGGAFIGLHKLTDIGWQEAEKTWSLSFENAPKVQYKQVVLANGAALSQQKLVSTTELIPARGQISAMHRAFELHTVVSGQHYAIPDESCVWVGASFDRGNDNSAVSDADDIENRNVGNALLGNDLSPDADKPLGQVIDRFAGVRCTTLDRFPIVGPVPNTDTAQRQYHDIHHGRKLSAYPAPSFYPGLAVVGGLGAKGIAIAPFAADLLADWATGGNQLIGQNRLVSPLRFLIRRLKRQQEK